MEASLGLPRCQPLSEPRSNRPLRGWQRPCRSRTFSSVVVTCLGWYEPSRTQAGVLDDFSSCGSALGWVDGCKEGLVIGCFQSNMNVVTRQRYVFGPPSMQSTVRAFFAWAGPKLSCTCVSRFLFIRDAGFLAILFSIPHLISATVPFEKSNSSKSSFNLLDYKIDYLSLKLTKQDQFTH